MPPTWLISLLSALGALGMAAAALRNSRVAGVLGLIQARQGRAQTDQLEASTVDTLFDRIEKLERDAEERRRKFVELRDALDELRRYCLNVRRSAARIGVSVSARGVLSVLPGDPILLVDDDPDILAMLSGFLEDEGYAVAVAGTVAEARARAAERTPACVIVDLWLGAGQSVAELVAELRHRAPRAGGLPVIVCTADRSARAKAMMTTLDAQGVIEKPFSLDAVLAVVRMAMASRQGATA